MEVDVGEEQTARLMHRLVDELPGLVAYWDTDLRLVLANADYCAFIGRPSADLVGQHFGGVLGHDVYAANLPFLEAALAGERQVFQRTLPDHLGRTRHMEVSYAPDVVDGAVAGIFALVTDVTDRVVAQVDLDEAQEIAGVASYVYRIGDGALSWSRQFYRMLGKDPLTGAPDLEAYLAMVHPDDLHLARSARESADEGVPHEMRYRLVVDGEVRHVHTRSRPVHDPTGAVVMMRGTIQDETELMRQADALEDANRRLADVIGMVGHDVRQPLGVVLGYLEEALEEWTDAPGADDGPTAHDRRHLHVATAFAAAHRMNRLLDDILVMVNLDSGALAVRPERLDLAEQVSTVLEVDHLPLVPHLLVRCTGDVEVDPFHLRQVLGNLLTNAARYGAPPFSVVVDATDAEVSVTVADAGEGVPDEFVPRLFDRFARAETGIATRTSGSGFGLHIVRELVLANGGAIVHEPVSPHGALFRVTFPRA